MAEIDQIPRVTSIVGRLRSLLCGQKFAQSSALVLLLAGLGAGPALASAAAGGARQPFSHSVQAVAGTGSPEVKHRPRVKRTSLTVAETTEILTVEIALGMRNFAELQERIQKGEIIDPAEMATRYFPAAADYQQVVQWAAGQGLTVSRTDPNHLAVFVQGTVAQIQQSFQATFARVSVDGTDYTSAVTAPSLPAEFAGAVAGIHGLQPHIRRHRLLRRPAAGGSGTASFLPAQIAAAYNAANTGLTGAGQVIAIFDNAFPAASDLSDFWLAAGIRNSPANIQRISIDGGPASPADSDSIAEASLDVEWASALAPGAVIRVYGANTNDDTSFDKTFQQIYLDLPTNPGLHQFSLSYGGGEKDEDNDYLVIEEQYLATLASAGVTIFAASGDYGAYADNTAVVEPNYPATDPSVTGVGGTTLVLNGNNAIVSETGWTGSGGGISGFFSRPAWQTGTGVPPGSFRLTPDVAAAADPNTGAVVIISGRSNIIGGTSWATPVWAAFCALLNQNRAVAGLGPVGLLNPKLYPLQGTSALHDIVSGGNSVYPAAAGYDMSTGLGSPNLGALLNATLSSSSAPAVTAELSGRFATIGQPATFAVAAYSPIALTYQWLRQAAGSSTWTPLSDNGTYSGSATATLVVSAASFAMNGDQFECDVTNAAGTATSVPVGLTVNPLGVTTLAGWLGAAGSVDATGSSARLNFPGGLRCDSAGNIYVADGENSTIRKITPAGVVTTLAGVAGTTGSNDGTGSGALFNGPGGVAPDAAGNVYVADSGNYTIRKITPTGVVTTLAGRVGVSSHLDGSGVNAGFSDPQNVAVDSSGNIYVADGMGETIRKVTPAGAVTTVAGIVGSHGLRNGSVGTAVFNDPTGVAVDAAGDIFVADFGNNAIREISASGNVTTLAGGINGNSDGSGSAARFSSPAGLALDSAGNVYVADAGNCTLREISPSGLTTTVAGLAGDADGVDGLPANARFSVPSDVALDPSGNIFVADTANCAIRRVVLTTLPVVANTAQVDPITIGGSITLQAIAAGGTLTYQWLLNGSPIAGATSSTLTLTNLQATNAGVYSVAVSNGGGTTTATIATLEVEPAIRLEDLSARGFVGTGANSLQAGFVLNGGGTKEVLLRGIGPTLTSFGVADALPTPQLTLNDANSNALATDLGWSASNGLILDPGATALDITSADAATMARVGAFALLAASADSAILAGQLLPFPARYTIVVNGTPTNPTGVALAEIYDADPGTPTARLINLSARAQVGAGDNLFAGGFVIGGSGTETLLLRAIGPGLASYGVTGVSPNPVLTLYNQASGAVIASNGGWSSAPTVGPAGAGAAVQAASAATMAAVGAFALTAGSADSALVVTLPQGAYSATVTGSTGVALVEIYEVSTGP